MYRIGTDSMIRSRLAKWAVFGVGLSLLPLVLHYVLQATTQHHSTMKDPVSRGDLLIISTLLASDIIGTSINGGGKSTHARDYVFAGLAFALAIVASVLYAAVTVLSSVHDPTVRGWSLAMFAATVAVGHPASRIHPEGGTMTVWIAIACCVAIGSVPFGSAMLAFILWDRREARQYERRMAGFVRVTIHDGHGEMLGRGTLPDVAAPALIAQMGEDLTYAPPDRSAQSRVSVASWGRNL
jgi:hypothetical protein